MTDDNSGGPGFDAAVAQGAAEVVSSVATATADAVAKVHGKFQLMFQRGYGITLFSAGFVAVVAAIVLRINRPDEVSTGVFFGILGLGTLLLLMAFAFFYIDVKSREKTLETLNHEGEQLIGTLTKLMLAEQQRIEAEKRKLEKLPPIGAG